MPVSHEDVRRRIRVALVARSTLGQHADALVRLLTRAAIVDDHGNLHSPLDGKFVAKLAGDIAGSLDQVTASKAQKYHGHDVGWPDSSSSLSANEKALRRAALDLLVNGGTAWHVAHPSYRPGDALVARDDQPSEGIETPWKWDDAPEGFDGDAVALFPDSPVGRRDADWLWSDFPDHVLLRVTVPPEDVREQNMRLLDEGYPSVVGTVPADWIKPVRRGYSDGAIGENATPKVD